MEKGGGLRFWKRVFQMVQNIIWEPYPYDDTLTIINIE